jgi:formylglycine-generating enzyme required for sulfatase activity
MELALIPPGDFDMGSPKELIEEELRTHAGDGFYTERLPSEGPRHRVRISKPYWLGTTEVTQEEYQRVMGSNPSKFQGDPKRPVEQVTWDDAVEFCRRLSELPAEKTAKRLYRLPTEAEWERASRAGTTTRYYFGDNVALLGTHAWFKDNSNGTPNPVGQKLPNPWGLFDIVGNEWEWCADRHCKHYYGDSSVDDPRGPDSGNDRVLRGGSWGDGPGVTRSAFRSWSAPDHRCYLIGFRVACEIPLDAAAGAPSGAKADTGGQAAGGTQASTSTPAKAPTAAPMPAPAPVPPRTVP